MKFIADVMLGRLAKRMRLLGFDVLYDRTLSDNEILRLALEQNRIILTRDTALAARPLAEKHLFIKSEQIQEQLAQVRSTCPLSPEPFTRCSVCNTPLERILKQDVFDRVPIYVFQREEDFFHCGSCGRIYWTGTHVSRMRSAGMIKKPGSSPQRK